MDYNDKFSMNTEVNHGNIEVLYYNYFSFFMYSLIRKKKTL